MPLRDEKELRRAHDLLVGILLGEAPRLRARLDEKSIELLGFVASTLCHVLRHDHNDTVQKFLEHVERVAAEEGYDFCDHSN
jgi:hypothetical protein